MVTRSFTSLLTVSSAAALGGARPGSRPILAQIRARTGLQFPKSSGWFGDFSEGESSFNAEGVNDRLDENPERGVRDGMDPLSREYPLDNERTRGSRFFHESPSAGWYDAWQTHFPAPDAGSHNPWRETPGTWDPQGWKQDAVPSYLAEFNPLTGERTGVARWFDASVLNYDSYGRRMLPSARSGARYTAAGGWQERAVNTSFGCDTPGCNTSASLQAFNPSTEQAKRCSLNVGVHPTDYDDEYSYEVVEHITVNGFAARKACNPHARGCNASAWRPIHQCVSGLPVDHLVEPTGTLVIEGKNSIKVDECAYNQHLLSMVAVVTCMVRPLPALGATNTPARPPMIVDQTVPLRCKRPGCTASATLYFSPYYAAHGGSCHLTITFNATDFDGTDHADEAIEYVSLEGTNISTNVRPGVNPCLARMEGRPQPNTTISVIGNLDVTSQVMAALPQPGTLDIAAKLSDFVDECAKDGYLLNGQARFTCQPGPDGAIPLPEPPAWLGSRPGTSLLQEPGRSAAPEEAQAGRGRRAAAVVRRPFLARRDPAEPAVHRH